MFDETVGLDVESPYAEDTKICDDTPPPLPDQQTQRTDSSSMLTPTPEHERVPIIPQPHLATRMTVTRVPRQSQCKQTTSRVQPQSQKKQANKQSQPQQLSIASSSGRLLLQQSQQSQAQKKARISNAQPPREARVDKDRCCSRKCRQRLDARGQGREVPKKCHFCNNVCHLKCIAFDQEACSVDHVQ